MASLNQCLFGLVWFYCVTVPNREVLANESVFGWWCSLERRIYLFIYLPCKHYIFYLLFSSVPDYLLSTDILENKV